MPFFILRHANSEGVARSSLGDRSSFETREEALAAAKACYPGEAVTVVEADSCMEASLGAMGLVDVLPLIRQAQAQQEKSEKEGHHEGFRETFVPVDHACSQLIPGHVFRVIGVGVDVHAIRVEYRITPALPQQNRAPGSLHWRAVDDLGNEYESCGGAYGPGEDGRSTRGVLSLAPLPRHGASFLRVFLSPYLERDMEDRVCKFEVAFGPTAP